MTRDHFAAWWATRAAHEAAVQADCTALEMRALFGVVVLVGSYGRTADRVGGTQLAQVVYGIEAPTRSQRGKMTAALRQLDAAGAIAWTPGKGTGRGTVQLAPLARPYEGAVARPYEGAVGDEARPTGGAVTTSSAPHSGDDRAPYGRGARPDRGHSVEVPAKASIQRGRFAEWHRTETATAGTHPRRIPRTRAALARATERAPGMTMTTPAPEWAQAAGISYRRLDHWTRRGWLRPLEGAGSGVPRVWPEGERAVARTLLQLVDAGLTLETAAPIARNVQRRPRPTTVRLARGISLTLEA